MSIRRSPLTTLLLVAIIAVYIVEMMKGGSTDTVVIYTLGGITAETLPNGEWWRLLAAMFLHIGLAHLALNVWALWQVGGLFEILFGSRRFAVTYFVSGIVASLSSAFFIPAQSVAAGASGAIFGVIGALIFALKRSPRWRHEPWARGLTQQLVAWAGFNILIGWFFPGIDNSAHLGGFAAGLLLGFVPHRVPPPPASGMLIEAAPVEPASRSPQDQAEIGRREE